MTYFPALEEESPFITAWNSADNSIPSRTSGDTVLADYTFNIDTLGTGPRVGLNSNIITAPDNNNCFWVGDIRSETDNDSDELNYFSIAFENTQNTLCASVQDQRRSLQDDLCYANYPSAKLTMYQNYRSGGDALAYYVRVLGMIIEV